MRLRRKRVEAASRQGQDGAEVDGASAAVRSRRGDGRWARMGDAFAKRMAALSPREQTLVAGGAVFLLLALVISVAVLPAWHSLQQGPARQQALNAQVARVAQLEAQAQALKSRPVWSGAEAATKLQASSAGLAAPGGAAGGAPGGAGGAAGDAAAEPLQLSLSTQQANATLRALPADIFAAWLTAAREQAHAVPSEAKLTRESGAAGGVEGADRWSGTVVMRLPP